MRPGYQEQILYILNKHHSIVTVELGDAVTDDILQLIDSAKREALKELPFTHDTMGFCEHFGKQFRPCAKCVVDERLAQLEQSKESE
jgi:hypothetical protein